MIYFSDFEAGGGGPPDPDYASTVLLLSCDGSSGSTTFTDESFVARGNGTANGNTNVSTANPKFGSGGMRLDGIGDFLSFADSADWNFGSGAFTLEGWFRIDADSVETGIHTFISQWTTPSNRALSLSYNGGAATNVINFSVSNNGTGTTFTLSANWTPTGDQYYHIAVDRSGNVWRLYIDGTMVASTTSATTMFDSATTLRIGARDSAGLTDFLKGYVDEIRITKGVARYASDGGFTVPTAAYPRS